MKPAEAAALAQKVEDKKRREADRARSDAQEKYLADLADRAKNLIRHLEADIPARAAAGDFCVTADLADSRMDYDIASRVCEYFNNLGYKTSATPYSREMGDNEYPCTDTGIDLVVSWEYLKR